MVRSEKAVPANGRGAGNCQLIDNLSGPRLLRTDYHGSQPPRAASSISGSSSMSAVWWVSMWACVYGHQHHHDSQQRRDEPTIERGGYGLSVLARQSGAANRWCMPVEDKGSASLCVVLLAACQPRHQGRYMDGAAVWVKVQKQRCAGSRGHIAAPPCLPACLPVCLSACLPICLP